MDFGGKGFITLKDFMNSDPVRRAQLTDSTVRSFTLQEIKDFLRKDKLFDVDDPASSITIDKFSRVFFPALSNVQKFVPLSPTNLKDDPDSIKKRLKLLDR